MTVEVDKARDVVVFGIFTGVSLLASGLAGMFSAIVRVCESGVGRAAADAGSSVDLSAPPAVSESGPDAGGL